MSLKPGDARKELAYFTVKKPGGPAGPEVYVHFNPESLQYTVQNTIKEEGKGNKKKQHVSQTSGKLTMQLVFDTTDTGEDVRVYTDDVAKFLDPDASGKDKTPPLVEFHWGAYQFAGLVEQYKETIDFFAAGGVPLRSTVDLTLASQDPKQIFNSSHNPSATVDQALSVQEPTVHPQPDQPGQSSGPGGASGLASALGDPRAARSIAALNGSASLRFGAGASLAVAGGVSLQAAAAFSTGVSAGIGGGASGPGSASVAAWAFQPGPAQPPVPDFPPAPRREPAAPSPACALPAAHRSRCPAAAPCSRPAPTYPPAPAPSSPPAAAPRTGAARACRRTSAPVPI